MTTPRPDAIMLGYRPRQPWVASPGFTVRSIDVVSSACDCLTGRVVPHEPEWNEVNSAFHYSSVASAEAAAKRANAVDFEVHATRLFPFIFEGAKVDPIHVRLTPPPFGQAADPPPPRLETLGLDVIALVHPTCLPGDGGETWLSFGCAPLSCSGLGAEHPVNRYCLLDQWDEAVRAAARFAAEEPEPGPFVVVEVLRAMRG